MKDKKIGRRTFLKTAALAAAATSIGSIAQPLTALADKPGSSPIHGVCWMGGGHVCKATYVDLGPVNKKGTHPVWVFLADGNNPYDTGNDYVPNRLQNNVFEGGGRLWPMWLAWSGNLNLYASTDGNVRLESVDNNGNRMWTDGNPERDLTVNPIKSGDELLALAAAGDIVLYDTGIVVDCPMTSAEEGDTVVDLNPDVGPFCNRSK